MKKLLFLCLLTILFYRQPVVGQSGFTLHIYHTNDQHAHHLPDRDGSGGVARLAAFMNNAREAEENVLLLDAGDRFSGTLFHYFYQGQDNVPIMNALGYDAMTLGNHEFDNGSAILADFITGLNLPVLAANVDVSADPWLDGLVSSYTVIDVAGEAIGIIGLLTPLTSIISQPEDTVIIQDDVVPIVQEVVDTLEAEGVNKIILLSHQGFEEDLMIAEALAGVDVIIGGHSNTIPTTYPRKLTGMDGNPVVVVQAGYHGLYVGHLDVRFDADGNLLESDGELIRLTASMPEDPAMVAIVEELEAPVKSLTDMVVGQTARPYRREQCFGDDCDLGALVTDAMREATSVDIAIMNTGGLRDNLPSGDVTLGDILTVLPFGNQISVFELQGVDVIDMLEHGVSSEIPGAFPQVSGVRFSWSPSAAPGNRIVSVEVLEQETWSPIDPDAYYFVASNDFMRGGGDGYTVLVDKALNAYDSFGLLDEVVAQFIARYSPVDLQTEGRISRQ